jgi:protein TonB
VPPALTAPDADSDVDAFLKRLNEVNAELPSARRQETKEPIMLWGPQAPSQERATAHPELPAPVKAPAVEQELIDLFRSSYREAEKREAVFGRKPKWGMIGGISAGVVAIAVAIAVPMALRGRSVTPVHPAVSPTPTKALAVEGTSTLKPSPVGPVSATAPAKAIVQKPAPAADQDSDTNNNTDQAAVSSDMMNQQLAASSRLPQGARKPAPVDAPPPSGFGVADLGGTGDPNAVGSTFKNTAKIKIAQLTVSAGVAGGLLIQRVNPTYPPLAKTARVSGTVVVAATISKTGIVTNVQAVSGPPMLRQAAVDAVRRWQYRPYLLNNQPMEVQTTVDVNFSL